MATGPWPLELTFARDGSRVRFESDKALDDWIGSERGGWANLAPPPNRTAAINQNCNLLESFSKEKTDSNLKKLTDQYLPSSGNFGKFSLRLPNNNSRLIFVSETIQPNQNSGNTQPDALIGRSLAYYYLAVNPIIGNAEKSSELLPDMLEAIKVVQELRGSDADFIARLQKLIDQTSSDWAKRIEGFEAKVALSAPKTFWKDRASRHNTQATINRTEWFWSMVAFVVAIVVAFGLNFYYAPPPGVVPTIVSDIQRAVAFATLVAVGVWWLRQKLRDLRMHEHFSEDADERATMVETYAALRATGLQDANLEPVLNALYRPAISAFREDLGPAMPIDTLIRAVGNFTASRAKGEE